MNINNQQQLHWLAVGRISDAARTEVERTGGRVVAVASDPAVALVGIAYTGKHDLAFTNASEIEIETFESELHLVWLSGDPLINAAYSSIIETQLIAYSEYEDILNGRQAALPVVEFPEIDIDDVTF